MKKYKTYIDISYRTYFIHGTLHLIPYNPKMKDKVVRLVERMNLWATDNKIPIIFEWTFTERLPEHYESFIKSERGPESTKKIRADVQEVFGNIF